MSLRMFSFFWKMGVISAYFQSVGQVVFSSDVLKITRSAMQSSYERILRTAVGIPSGLRLNLAGSLHMNLRTRSGFISTLQRYIETFHDTRLRFFIVRCKMVHVVLFQ